MACKAFKYKEHSLSLHGGLLNLQARGSILDFFLVRFCWPVDMIFIGPRAILQAWAVWAATQREDYSPLLVFQFYTAVKKLFLNKRLHYYVNLKFTFKFKPMERMNKTKIKRIQLIFSLFFMYLFYINHTACAYIFFCSKLH